MAKLNFSQMRVLVDFADFKFVDDDRFSCATHSWRGSGVYNKEGVLVGEYRCTGCDVEGSAVEDLWVRVRIIVGYEPATHIVEVSIPFSAWDASMYPGFQVVALQKSQLIGRHTFYTDEE